MTTTTSNLNGIYASAEINDDRRFGTLLFDTGNRIVKITAKWLTPTEAAQMLKLHDGNRKQSVGNVEAIQNDIEADCWMFNGDTITFARTSDGIVIGTDGQHRLAAIARGDRAVPVLIVENLDPDVTDTIDQGKPRSVADILKLTYGLSSVKNVNVVTAMAVILLAQGSKSAMSRNRRKDVAQFAAKNIETLEVFAGWAVSCVRDCQEFTHSGSRKSYASMTAAPVATLAYYMVSQGADYESVTEFFQRIADGVTSDSDRTNVIQAIRKRQKSGLALSRMATGADGTDWFNNEFYVYINAYNRWIRNELTVKFQSPKNRPTSFADFPAVERAPRRAVNA